MRKGWVYLLTLLLLPSLLPLGAWAASVSVPPTYGPVVYVNPGGQFTVYVSLNTVNGAGYKAFIGAQGPSGVNVTANVTEYPPGPNTTTANVTLPVGVKVVGPPGQYVVTVGFTEYNASSPPMVPIARALYNVTVMVVQPQILPPVVVTSTNGTATVTVPVSMPGPGAWHLVYSVDHPNATLAARFWRATAAGNPVLNVSVTPSATTGTASGSVTFTVRLNTDIKYGVIPVHLNVTELANGTNAVLASGLYFFAFVVLPPGWQSGPGNTLVVAPSWPSFTTVGHVKFGNFTVLPVNGRPPASILGLSQLANGFTVLFTNDFNGTFSFYSNATPLAVYADGKPLARVDVASPSALPLGSWAYIGGKVYVYADPTNVTVVYPSTTTTTSTSTASSTSPPSPFSTVSTPSTTSTTSNTSTGFAAKASAWIEGHKAVVLVGLTFLFLLAIVLLVFRK
jgi:hypothetical protein